MILITNSYFYPLDSKQWRFKQPYPPLGTLIATSVLKNAGFDTSFFDNSLEASTNSVKKKLTQLNPKHLIIYDDGFNYLTKMCLTTMREAAFEMIQTAKAIGAVVIVCNSDSSDHYEKYLKAGADFVIRGEGEETLLELIQTLNSSKDISLINGIAFKSHETIQVNPARTVIKNLDALPLPAWDLVDMASYRNIWEKYHGYFSLNLATTRGCPYKCNWCAKPIYGNRYNARTPENVVGEIEMLLQHHKPDHFWMSDDIFGLKPGWVQRFRDLVREKNLKFKYKIQSRADLLVEDNTVEALAESGAESVWMGAESGSQKILDAMDKGITINQIKEATQLLKKYSIKVGYFLQFGYLEETLIDIQQTTNLVLDMMPNEIGISVSYPLPGTKFYETVKNQLKEKQNWVDSDDLDLMYESSFSPIYYKILHRYLHSCYRVKRGMDQLKNWKILPIRPIASMVYHWPLNKLQKIRLNTLSHAGR